MKKISIIIVTYNSENHIYDCLNSVFKYNDIGKELEVIVVDNCSSNFCEMEKKINELYGDLVTVIRNKINGGYGQGNNVGINCCSSPYVMIMNPDVRMCMPVFSYAFRYLENNKNCAALGMRQYIPGEGWGHSFGISYRSPKWVIWMKPIYRLLDVYLHKYMYIQGACFFLNKEIFQKIGLFDENVFMYSEEDDIHYRIHRKQSYFMAYCRDLQYFHLHKEKSCYDMSLSFLKKDLCSKQYLDSRDGLSSTYAIKKYLVITNQQLFMQRLLAIVGRMNSSYYKYLLSWKKYLLELKR